MRGCSVSSVFDERASRNDLTRDCAWAVHAMLLLHLLDDRRQSICELLESYTVGLRLLSCSATDGHLGG